MVRSGDDPDGDDDDDDNVDPDGDDEMMLDLKLLIDISNDLSALGKRQFSMHFCWWVGWIGWVSG